MTDRARGAIDGLLAAALFGASAPLAKLLLPGAGPLLLAALLYLGAGAALSFRRVFARRATTRAGEAKLRTSDLPLLAGIIVSGGVVGPILMLTGLGRVTGIAGSLLLNLEAPFTMLIALLLFKEHMTIREAAAALLVVIGGASLGLRTGELSVDAWGILSIAGACLAWGLDNNLTQRLSLRDPEAVARVKCLGAGSCTLLLALARGHSLPSGSILLPALAVGGLSYGLSIVLDVYALRYLGAAREAAFFATAPFAGALLAVPLLGEVPVFRDGLAAVVMGLGVMLLLRARHSHRHTHAELEHDHLHVHDEHHRHAHEGEIHEPHAHPHRHDRLTHEHPHVSDAHHRHEHGG